MTMLIRSYQFNRPEVSLVIPDDNVDTVLSVPPSGGITVAIPDDNVNTVLSVPPSGGITGYP